MVLKMKHLWKCLLLLGLCLLISIDGFVPAAFAQEPALIYLSVVEGEGAISNIREHVSHDPVVKVEDDDHRPVTGAVVVFALPVSGTSGEFVNGSKTLTIVTDRNGSAAAHGLKANDVPGKLQIYVTASYRGLRARTLINQVVQAPAGAKTQELRLSKSSGKWKWILLGVAAAAGVGVAISLKGHGSSSSNAPTPVSVTAGAVVFGNPQ
jgi:hypothetical protein